MAAPQTQATESDVESGTRIKTRTGKVGPVAESCCRGHERGGEVQGPLCQVSGSGGPSAGRVFAGGPILHRWRCSEGMSS